MKRQSVLITLVILILVATGTALADLSSGLMAHYSFDGNAADVTGSGHDGIVYGATLTTDRFGNANSAYSFDGVDDYIALSNPSDFMFSGSFSVSLWTFVAENTNTYDPLIWLGGSGLGSPDFTLSKSRSGYVNGRLYAQAIMGSAPSPWVTSTATGDEVLNRWIHLVGIVDQGANTLSFYVDDVFQGITDLGDFDLSSVITPGANIGRDMWVSMVDYHYGFIDDVRIYNRTLTRSEVTELNLVPIPSAVILGAIGMAFASWRLRIMKRNNKLTHLENFERKETIT